MNAYSPIAYSNENADRMQSAARTSAVNMGLGPNQLSWLRSNIDAFRHLEDQRALLQHDALRAARIAGLI